MHDITKDLCGEIPFEGFQEWRTEYERSFGAGVGVGAGGGGGGGGFGGGRV